MLSILAMIFRYSHFNKLISIKQPLASRSTFLPYIFYSILLFFCSACGPTLPKSKTFRPKKNLTQSQFNPLGNLLAQAQSALKKIEDPDPKAQSRVSFALLHKHVFPQDEASQLALSQAHFSLSVSKLKAAGVNSLVSSKLAERFQIITLPTQTDLPIDLKVLEPALIRLKSKLSDYKGISIISYQGHALQQGLHINLSCSITKALSEHKLFMDYQNSLLIASLASFEVFDLPEFAQHCATANYPWLKPVAELLNQNEVRLITRGLNQWGRPELEWGPIQKSQLAKVFPKFIAITESVRSKNLSETLKAFQKLKFTKCQRPENHYDLTCQQIEFE